jgi:hypothetical protein
MVRDQRVSGRERVEEGVGAGEVVAEAIVGTRLMTGRF